MLENLLLLLQWDTLQKIILNTLLVSIPEEWFVVMFTLTIMSELYYWQETDRKKLINSWDYPRIIIPVLVTALTSNILRYTGLDFGIGSFIPIVVLYIAILLTNDLKNDALALRWMGRAAGCLFISLIILGLSELIYAPFLIYATGKTIKEINNNLWQNFLSALPSRVIIYSTLAYVTAKQRTLLKGNILKYISESRFLSITTLFITAIDLFYVYAVHNLIFYQKILINLTLLLQVAAVAMIVSFPLINIFALLGCMYYVKNKEMQSKKKAYDRINSLLNDINSYANNGNYDNIKWKLNEFGMGMEEIVTSLYNLEKKVKFKKEKY